MRRTGLPAWMLLGLLGGCLATPLFAQPQPGAEPGSQPTTDVKPDTRKERRPRGFDDRQTARGMLIRWVEDMDKRRPVLVEALRQLDAGEPVEKVRDYVRRNSPPLMRFGPTGSGPRDLESMEPLEPRSGDSSLAQPPDRPPPPPDAPPGAAPTAEERDIIAEIMGAYDPAAKSRLETAEKAGRQQEVDRLLQDARRKLRGLIELRRSDRQMFDLRLKEIAADRGARAIANDLAAEERSAGVDSSGVASLHQQLRKAVELRQNYRVALQALELARIEERVSKIRQDIVHAGANASLIVDSEMESMLQKAREHRRDGTAAAGDEPGRKHAPKTRDGADPSPRH